MKMEGNLTPAQNGSQYEIKADTDGERTSAGIIGMALVLTILIVVSAVGNAIVIFLVITNIVLKQEVSNLFIVNLAVADFFNGTLVMMPSLVALVRDRWTMGAITCSIQCGFNYCFIIVSMLTLAMVSIDRYQATKHSLKYNLRMTKRRIWAMIAYSWLQGVSFAVTPLLLDWVHYDYHEMVCAINWWHDGSLNSILVYVVVAFVVCFAAPCIVICYSYVIIIAAARKLHQPHLQKQNKVVKSLIVVMIVFFICMTPFCITKLIKVITGHRYAVAGYLNTVSTYMQYLSSCVNPFIYVLLRRDYKRAFIKLFSFRRNSVTRINISLVTKPSSVSNTGEI